MKNPAHKIMTAEEFADEVLDGRRSARWVRERIGDFLRTKGAEGIAVSLAGRPYLIPPTEAALCRMGKAEAEKLLGWKIEDADSARIARLMKKHPRIFRKRAA